MTSGHLVSWSLHLITLFAAFTPALAADTADSGAFQWIEARMPSFKVTKEDAYLCTAITLPDEPLKLVGIEPLAKQEVAHHLLLFGCEAPASAKPVWECHMVSPCGSGAETGISHGEQVMYGWARNAPGMHLPEGAGFSIGPKTGIRTAVLQVHYQIVRPEGDATGVRIKLTRAPQPRGAGMMMFATGFAVPPHRPSYLVPNTCCYRGFQPLEGFAFRVHAHALGRRIWMERTSHLYHSRAAHVVADQDPQLPQGFYPVTHGLKFLPGDDLKVTCDFNSSGRNRHTYAGSGSKNEMCNMYMMVTSELPFFLTCGNSYASVSLTGPGGIPPGSTLVAESPQRWRPPPSIGSAAAAAHGPTSQHSLGQISGVAAGVETDTLWVLQRGRRIWDEKTFLDDKPNVVANASAIPEATVLQLAKDSGKVLRAWGKGRLVMPHSITVDAATGDIWVTDVGLHQALKFSPEGKLLATIGQRLEPGHDDNHLCKPSAVAVSRAGDVLIADGYCNSRVMHFTSSGKLVGKYQLRKGHLNIPHGLVIDDCMKRLYVADRESLKVQQFPLIRPREPPKPPPKATRGGASNRTDVMHRRILDSPKASQGVFVAKEETTWDMAAFGKPYGVTAGPYGSVFVLCWALESGHVTLVLSNYDDADSHVMQTWRLPDVAAPHDVTLTAAPLAVTGVGERALAVYVAETRSTGSSLRKFIILHPDMTLPQPSVESASPNASVIADTAQEQAQTNRQNDASEHTDTVVDQPAAPATYSDEQPAVGTSDRQGNLSDTPTSLRSKGQAGMLLLAAPCAAVFVGLVVLVWWGLQPSTRRTTQFQSLSTVDDSS